MEVNIEIDNLLDHYGYHKKECNLCTNGLIWDNGLKKLINCQCNED